MIELNPSFLEMVIARTLIGGIRSYILQFKLVLILWFCLPCWKL